MSKYVEIKLAREEENVSMIVIIDDDKLDAFLSKLEEAKKESNKQDWVDWCRCAAYEDNLIKDAIKSCGGTIIVPDATVTV